MSHANGIMAIAAMVQAAEAALTNTMLLTHCHAPCFGTRRHRRYRLSGRQHQHTHE
jgi:hypothetical protein